MLFAPYVQAEDDRLAQLCQAQIFFSLLSSIALKYDPATLSNATNIDTLLSISTFVPLALTVYFELRDDCLPSATAWLRDHCGGRGRAPATSSAAGHQAHSMFRRRRTPESLERACAAEGPNARLRRHGAAASGQTTPSPALGAVVLHTASI